MKSIAVSVTTVAFLATSSAAFAQQGPLDESIFARADASWDQAQKIWGWAEVGYHEERSAALLALSLQSAGFRVERGVAQIPTAFIATAGSGKPVIAILGEYDALPGLSQESVPERKARPGAGAGHACGHHLFGVASASASIALAEALEVGRTERHAPVLRLPGRRGGSAKAFMVRAGLFNDCDAVLHWHPSSRNSAGDESSQARIAVKFRFRGKSAHAAGAPEQGRSALDAVELTAHASELLREHTPDFTRIHHVITSGGNAPNVVPDFAEAFFYVRHPQSEVVRKLYPRLLKCAQAGALATETQLETEYLGGIVEILPNETLARVTSRYLELHNNLAYDDAEKSFAAKIAQTLERPLPLETLRRVEHTTGQVGKGSTDVGDVSWVVPTAGFSTACWVPGTPAHSWQAVAAGGTSIGRKGMILAARVLAATASELFRDPKILADARAELARRRAEKPYQSLLGENQKPPLDYRDLPGR